MVGMIVGLACDATAAALHAGNIPLVALNMLEQERGILATSLEDMRTDLIDLQSRSPELGNEFIRLRGVLDAPVASLIIGNDDSPLRNQGY